MSGQGMFLFACLFGLGLVCLGDFMMQGSGWAMCYEGMLV